MYSDHPDNISPPTDRQTAGPYHAHSTPKKRSCTVNIKSSLRPWINASYPFALSDLSANTTDDSSCRPRPYTLAVCPCCETARCSDNPNKPTKAVDWPMVHTFGSLPKMQKESVHQAERDQTRLETGKPIDALTHSRERSEGKPANIERPIAPAPAPQPPLVKPVADMSGSHAPQDTTFVNKLVSTATEVVQLIWPLAAHSSLGEPANANREKLSLRIFIQEVLRRSKSSFSTLQVALYYLVLLKDHIPTPEAFAEAQRTDDKEMLSKRAMLCGRRMFLTSLVLAAKYLQDHNYSARAWSKISGLETREVNSNERLFLAAIDWNLHLPKKIFDKWNEIVVTLSVRSTRELCWATVMPLLTPKFEKVEHLFWPDATNSPCAIANTPARNQVPGPARPPTPPGMPVNHRTLYRSQPAWSQGVVARPYMARGLPTPGPTPHISNITPPFAPTLSRPNPTSAYTEQTTNSFSCVIDRTERVPDPTDPSFYGAQRIREPSMIISPDSVIGAPLRCNGPSAIPPIPDVSASKKRAYEHETVDASVRAAAQGLCHMSMSLCANGDEKLMSSSRPHIKSHDSFTDVFPRSKMPRLDGPMHLLN